MSDSIVFRNSMLVLLTYLRLFMYTFYNRVRLAKLLYVLGAND